MMRTIGLATQLDLGEEEGRVEHESKMDLRLGVRMTGERLTQQSRQRGLEGGLGICLGVCGNFLNVQFLVDSLTLRAENKKIIKLFKKIKIKQIIYGNFSAAHTVYCPPPLELWNKRHTDGG